MSVGSMSPFASPSALLLRAGIAAVKSRHAKLNSLFDNDRLPSENEICFLGWLCQKGCTFAHVEIGERICMGAWRECFEDGMIVEQQANGS